MVRTKDMILRDETRRLDEVRYTTHMDNMGENL